MSETFRFKRITSTSDVKLPFLDPNFSRGWSEDEILRIIFFLPAAFFVMYLFRQLINQYTSRGKGQEPSFPLPTFWENSLIIFATCGNPWLRAISAGVLFFSEASWDPTRILTEAPAFSKLITTLAWPLFAAKWRGVHPVVVCGLTSESWASQWKRIEEYQPAPCWIRCAQTSAWPKYAAQWSGVLWTLSERIINAGRTQIIRNMGNRLHGLSFLSARLSE